MPHSEEMRGLLKVVEDRPAGSSGAHTHPVADVTALQASLDGKAATGHGHAIADTTGLQAALDAKQATGSYITSGGALGTPSGGTLTNCSGLPQGGVVGLVTDLAAKQATLVSATNIKTINGNTLLGSGDLVLGGSGTVTTASVVSANGFAGTVANATTTPAITLTTTITGLLKGNGTAISAAAAGTDYVAPGGNIGAATGTSLTTTGAQVSSGGGIGYATGAGGTIAQSGSKTGTVILNKLCGTITMVNTALANATTVAFTLTNSFIAATDFVMVQHASGGTLGAYNFAVAPASGSAVISVRNVHTASLGEAIVLRFVVIKAVTA